MDDLDTRYFVLPGRYRPSSGRYQTLIDDSHLESFGLRVGLGIEKHRLEYDEAGLGFQQGSYGYLWRLLLCGQ